MYYSTQLIYKWHVVIHIGSYTEHIGKKIALFYMQQQLAYQKLIFQNYHSAKIVPFIFTGKHGCTDGFWYHNNCIQWQKVKQDMYTQHV